MKRFLILLLVCTASFRSLAEFRSIQQRVERFPASSFLEVPLFKAKLPGSEHEYLSQSVSRFDLVQTDPSSLQFIANHNGPLRLALPIQGQWETLLLVKNEALDQFQVTTQNASGTTPYPYHAGTYFLGVMENHPGTFAAISFFEDDIIGMIVTADGNYVLGKSNVAHPVSNEYIIYNDKDLLVSDVHPCAFKEDLHANTPKQANNSPTPEAYTSNCVKFYFECDFKTYTDKGSSVPNTTNYATALFNLTSTLYLNDSIVTGLAQINVWTVTDPYAASATTSAMLTAFSTQMSSTVYSGDIAHLLSTRSAGGGIAWLDVLCSSNYYKCGVSASLSTTITALPTYSWNAEVVTHEIGHNLGSPHTHACAWNGNNTRIDNCAGNYNVQYQEGNCNSFPPNPAGGGTIMSYCHLQAVGINFANGFGPQPGTLIRSNINSAPCLGICVACELDVTFTGTFSDPLTESSTWIKSSGQTTILSTSNVKLDADPTSGYVLFAPASNTEAFTAAPSINSASFVAQAYNGCSSGEPSKPGVGENQATASGIGNEDLRVYPNPASTQITLWQPSLAGHALSIAVIGLDGRTLQQVNEFQFSGQAELTISQLTPGIYLLRIKHPQGTQLVRFQKM